MLWMQWIPNVFWMTKNKLYWLMKRMEALECQLLHLPVNLLTLIGRRVNMWSHQISWSEERLWVSWKLLWDSKIMSEVNKSWALHADVISKVAAIFIDKGKPQTRLIMQKSFLKSFLQYGCFICFNCLHLYLLMSHFLNW